MKTNAKSTQNPECFSPAASFIKAAREMRLLDVGPLVASEGGRRRGMITDQPGWSSGSRENLSEQILHVQEEERLRISRELHDEVGHALMAIGLNLETLKRTTTAANQALQAKFADTEALLQQTMDTVHRFARELRPAMLDDLGLLPTLRSYLRDFANRTGLRINFHADAGAEALDRDRKTVVFRIAQESLTNVSKHAQANRVEFSVRQINDTICVEIADNGKSFEGDPMESARRKQRLGLAGMQERVGLVGGTFTITPRPGAGTTVRVVIPFKAAATAWRRGSQRVRPGAPFTPAFMEG